MSPMRLLVVGAGPAGCYVVEQLNKHCPGSHIDIIDSLPQPFGLLRTGVAPDHERIKNLLSYFEKILSVPHVHFYGNVTLGEQVTLEELSPYYHAIFCCTGTLTDNFLPVIQRLYDNYSASREVVQWYNGYQHLNSNFKPELLRGAVGIVGMGNVSLDIARILLKDPNELRKTEMPEDVISTIEASRITDVHIIVRRGPAQAKCTPLELEELFSLDDINVRVHLDEFNLSEADQVEIEGSSRVKKNVALLKEAWENQSPEQPEKKQLHIHFYSKGHRVMGEKQLTGLELERTALSGPGNNQKMTGTGQYYSLNFSYLISCIGYRGVALEGLPFDERAAVIPNQEGRVIDDTDELPLVYVAGWIKRGAQGVIGTNKRGATETVARFISDFEKRKETVLPAFSLSELLEDKKLQYFTLEEWKRTNEMELSLGEKEGKRRKKFTNPKDLLHLLGPRESRS